MSDVPTSRIIVPIWTAAGMAGANTSRTLFEGDELPYMVDFRHDLAVGQGVGEITSCTSHRPPGWPSGRVSAARSGWTW